MRPTPYKGILLAGGLGTRFDPMTRFCSKQLLPVYDKPMIYYPLSLLMKQGIREILIITTATHLPLFTQLMGDGTQWGMRLVYQAQVSPGGIAQALMIGQHFIQKQPIILVLGDNIFGGKSWDQLLHNALAAKPKAMIFLYPVNDVSAYGSATLDKAGQVIFVEEKTQRTRAGYAITGLYLYDHEAVAVAQGIQPSFRGELEITTINQHYLSISMLTAQVIDPTLASWFDAGTPETLLSASQYVATWQQQSRAIMACPEAIAYQNQWIALSQFADLAKRATNHAYRAYLHDLLRQWSS
ncbi:MAG: NTP transferase domain-containing protein [Neisseriales bacterium]|nr:MAG: NTP transferase domain-containing protein [Neisseriales bacterium]